MQNSMIEFGSAYVFTFAGAFGVAGAVITGRRTDKYNSKRVKFVMDAHHVYVLGAFLTILGCFGIPLTLFGSPGTVLQSHGGMDMANLWISGAVSSITALKLLTFMNLELDIHYIAIYQGFIAGMVFISSACNDTTAWQAGLHGLMSGGVFALSVYAFD